jgi:cation diffusion facilitator family transporter
MAANAESLRTILYALGANLAIALAKTAAAITTGSSAMLAEAIHSFADAGNQLLLLWGVRAAKRPPSPDYPLGWGKAVFFWSFIVALVLFSLGGLFSVYEGWHKLADPQPLSYPWVAVAILVFGLLAESISLRACLQEVRQAMGGRPFRQWLRETRRSALVVILGEDIAALVGLALALLAVLGAILTGDATWDALGSIAIGVVLVVVAIGLGNQIKGLLIGRSADPVVEARMRAFLEGRGEIERVYRMITMQLGTTVMVAVKARMKARDAAGLVAAINRCEAEMRAEFPEIQWLFFEPDVAD